MKSVIRTDELNDKSELRTKSKDSCRRAVASLTTINFKIPS